MALPFAFAAGISRQIAGLGRDLGEVEGEVLGQLPPLCHAQPGVELRLQPVLIPGKYVYFQFAFEAIEDKVLAKLNRYIFSKQFSFYNF